MTGGRAGLGTAPGAATGSPGRSVARGPACVAPGLCGPPVVSSGRERWRAAGCRGQFRLPNRGAVGRGAVDAASPFRRTVHVEDASGERGRRSAPRAGARAPGDSHGRAIGRRTPLTEGV